MRIKIPKRFAKPCCLNRHKIVTISQTCHKQFATNIHHQNRFSRLYSQAKHRTERLRSCLMCFIYTYLLTSPLRAKLNYQNSIICTISIAPLRSYLNSELTILFFNDHSIIFLFVTILTMILRSIIHKSIA